MTWDKTRCFGSCDAGASKAIPSIATSTSSTATAPAPATGGDALGELAAVSSSPASAADLGVLRCGAFGIDAPPRALPDPGVLFLPEPSACAVITGVRFSCVREGLVAGPAHRSLRCHLGRHRPAHEHTKHQWVLRTDVCVMRLNGQGRTLCQSPKTKFLQGAKNSERSKLEGKQEGVLIWSTSYF